MLPSIEESLSVVIQFGSAASGLLAFFAFFALKKRQGSEPELLDLFVVGAAGSAVPTGALLIYAAFDPNIIQRLADSQVYIGFAGAALLFIFYKTFKEKLAEH